MRSFLCAADRVGAGSQWDCMTMVDVQYTVFADLLHRDGVRNVRAGAFGSLHSRGRTFMSFRGFAHQSRWLMRRSNEQATEHCIVCIFLHSFMEGKQKIQRFAPESF